MNFYLYLISTGGNTSGIVIDEDGTLTSQYREIAYSILGSFPGVEQVGIAYVIPTAKNCVELQMMGNEFCGNACRATGYLWRIIYGATSIRVRCSGFDSFLTVHANSDSSELFLPEAIVRSVRHENELTLVDLAGIRHIVVATNDSRDDYSLIEQYRSDFPAIGLMRRHIHGPFEMEISPLVWVRDMNIYTRESGCLSGSLAAVLSCGHSTEAGSAWSVIQPCRQSYFVRSIMLDGLVFLRVGGETHIEGSFPL